MIIAKTSELTEVIILLVELIENSLHPLIDELERWQTIIGGHYIDYLLEEQRNSLVDRARGYSTVYEDFYLR